MKVLLGWIGLMVVVAPGQDWPGFRGVNGDGEAVGGSPPVEWGEGKNIAWKVELPGPGASSPVVVGERVYVTCHTGYGLGAGNAGDMGDLKRHLFCLKLGDGSVVWEREVAAAQPESAWAKRMEWHGYASSTPVVDADGVVCFFGKSGVHAWSHGGEKQWEAAVGDDVHGWGSASSPVIVDDLVVVNAFVESGALVALERKTGKEKWRYEGLKESWNTPAVVELEGGKKELVLGVFGKLLGIDAASGEELWSCAAADYYIVGSPVEKDGVVYSLAGKGFEAATAVKVGGRGEVTATHRLWQTRKGSNVSSPVLHDGKLYFAHEQGSFFYCLDAETGEEIYQERLPRRFGLVYSSPVLAGGKIYLFSRDSGAVVIEAGDEYKVLAENADLDEGAVNGCPAVVGGRLVVRTDLGVYCIVSR